MPRSGFGQVFTLKCKNRLSGVNMIDIQGFAVSSLPKIEISGDHNPPSAAKPRTVIANPLERKILINASMLINAGDSVSQCARKVADSMADAVGLSVDFSILAG